MIILVKKYKKLNKYLKKAEYYNNFAGRTLKAVFNAKKKYKEIEGEEITTNQMQEIFWEKYNGSEC